MDIEEAQKINRLAKELITHGIAKTSEEATEQAEKMIRKTAPEAKTSLYNSEMRYVEGMVTSLAADIRHIAAALAKMSDNHSKLQEQVNAIAQLAQQGKTPVTTPAISHTASDTGNNSETDNAETGTPAKSGEGSKNRGTGSTFSEEDVAIDKIFYFGKK